MGYQPVTLSVEELAAIESKLDGEDLLVLRGDKDMSPWVVVVRRPTRQESLGYKAAAKRDQTTANETLIGKIAVFPGGADWERQIARWPFLCDGIADDATFKKFVGLSVEAGQK